MFTVRVRHTEPATPDLYDIEYGTKADLEYFYSLNNPNGSPSNILTFQNHFGTQINVVMAGDFNAQLQGIQVDECKPRTLNATYNKYDQLCAV
jgi:hypothetical protein